ncbi:hypothetical protein GQ600_27378 [Phytophthora cactorum]|nr:hypothetical protein GQ600_27378 [Phytophthora cactorum]
MRVSLFIAKPTQTHSSLDSRPMKHRKQADPSPPATSNAAAKKSCLRWYWSKPHRRLSATIQIRSLEILYGVLLAPSTPFSLSTAEVRVSKMSGAYVTKNLLAVALLHLCAMAVVGSGSSSGSFDDVSDDSSSSSRA